MQKSSSLRNFSLGMQHLLAMYAGSVVVPLIIGAALKFTPTQMALLIAADLLASGVATIFQTLKFKGIGIRLPVVLGSAFPVVSPLIAIGLQYDFQTAVGAMLVSGLFVLLNAPFFSRLSPLFPPVVIGSVLTIIGTSLAPVALNNIAGGLGSSSYGSVHNILLGLLTFVVVVLCNRYLRGFWQAISILIGLIVGTLVAAIAGYVDFGAVGNAGWVGAVQPLAFGLPKFVLMPIITMCVIALIVQVESVSVFMILSEICGKKASKAALARGFRAEGLAIIFAALFNSFSKTTFNQNVGLIQLTKVTRVAVVVYAGIIMIIMSFLPKIAALVLAVPSAVLGGAMLLMFGMVAMAGVRQIAKAGLEDVNNMIISGSAIVIGIGVSVTPMAFEKLPQWCGVLTGSGVVVGSLTAILLNVLFNFASICQQEHDIH